MDQLALKITKFIKQNRKEFIALILILLLGAILRLYKIDQYLTFLGDEGRDVIVVRRLLVEADPILVGPGTSIGNMYLGPLYYYFMAPWLWIANLSPVGPAVGVAVLGIATIFLVWWVSREWFGKVASVVVSLLYAISPTIIIYSRSSWNPNIMPFFALLCIYGIWRVWQKNDFKWMLVLGISFAFVMQSHYLGLLLAPVFGLFWLVTFFKSKSKKTLLVWSAISGLVFAFLMSPLVIFDARHGWRNFDALKKFFLERQTTVSAKPWNALPEMIPLLDKINSRLVVAREMLYGPIITLILLVPLLFITKLTKKIKLTSINRSAYFLLFTWLTISLIGLGLYKQEIYDHYFGFIFAAPFLIIGGLSQNLVDNFPRRGLSLVITFVIVLVGINLVNSPIKDPAQRQLQRTEFIAGEVNKLSHGKPFNLALIAERNYDDAYQYFLERDRALMVDIDPQRTDETITDQLFVICELPAEECDPTHNPKAEVANFGWTEIENQWDIMGITVFKLIHTEQ